MTPLRCRYRTDLTDAQWRILEPLIPAPKPGGRPPVHQRRELLNAMPGWLRAGCAWRLLPHDLPPRQTVYHYVRCWRLEGRWEQNLLVDTLGLLLAVHVTAADVSDTDGAMALLGRLDRRRLPRLCAGWVDGGYRGGFLAWAAEKVKLTLEVVQRADGRRHRRWLPAGAEPPTVRGSRWSRAAGWWSGPSHGWGDRADSARTTSSCRHR